MSGKRFINSDFIEACAAAGLHLRLSRKDKQYAFFPSKSDTWFGPHPALFKTDSIDALKAYAISHGAKLEEPENDADSSSTSM